MTTLAPAAPAPATAAPARRADDGSAGQPSELQTTLRDLQQRQLATEYLMVLLATDVPRIDSFISAVDAMREAVEASPDVDARRGFVETLRKVTDTAKSVRDARRIRG